MKKETENEHFSQEQNQSSITDNKTADEDAVQQCEREIAAEMAQQAQTETAAAQSTGAKSKKTAASAAKKEKTAAPRRGKNAAAAQKNSDADGANSDGEKNTVEQDKHEHDNRKDSACQEKDEQQAALSGETAAGLSCSEDEEPKSGTSDTTADAAQYWGAAATVLPSAETTGTAGMFEDSQHGAEGFSTATQSPVAAESAPNAVYCVKCGAANRNGAKFCVDCGAGLGGSAAQIKAKTDASAPPQYCNRCGAVNPVSAVCCVSCGAPLKKTGGNYSKPATRQTQLPQQNVKKKKSPVVPVVAVVLTVMLLTIIGVLAYLQVSQNIFGNFNTESGSGTQSNGVVVMPDGSSSGSSGFSSDETSSAGSGGSSAPASGGSSSASSVSIPQVTTTDSMSLSVSNTSVEDFTSLWKSLTGSGSWTCGDVNIKFVTGEYRLYMTEYTTRSFILTSIERTGDTSYIFYGVWVDDSEYAEYGTVYLDTATPRDNKIIFRTDTQQSYSTFVYHS